MSSGSASTLGSALQDGFRPDISGRETGGSRDESSEDSEQSKGNHSNSCLQSGLDSGKVM